MNELIYTIIIGLIAGAIASALMGKDNRWYVDILLGVLGAVIGGFLFGLLGLGAAGLLWSLVVAVIGACVAIWIGRQLGVNV